MKVFELLDKFGFKPKEIYKTGEWDPLKQTWKRELVPNDKIIIRHAAHADDSDMIMRNLDKELEHHTILGPMALFAFKIRGPRMAIYMINMIPLGGMGYKIMRFDRWNKSNERHDDLLQQFQDWAKIGLQEYSSDYFVTWKTVESLKEDK